MRAHIWPLEFEISTSHPNGAMMYGFGYVNLNLGKEIRAGNPDSGVELGKAEDKV